MRDDAPYSDDPDSRPVGSAAASAAQTVISLRVLATTDIHMQLLGHDYMADRGVGHAGLAGLATLIESARVEARAAGMASLLIDNGDFLQGSALGQALADTPVTQDHPLVATIREMGYDAIGLGNHDLDHGTRYLTAIAAHASAPLICSNLHPRDGSPIVANAIIRCATPAGSGTVDGTTLQIGLVSVMPERTALWNAGELDGWAEVRPTIPSVQSAVADLRARGADVVLLLAHLGVEETKTAASPKDDARHLAALPGVDAIITGHTHRRLPGRDHAGYDSVDVDKSTLSQRPAAMPGFEASDLAVLDLRLGRAADRGWEVLDHKTELRPNTAIVPANPRVMEICRPTHDGVRKALAAPCGYLAMPLHNFFSLAVPTATCAVQASAKERIVRRGIAGTPHAALPVLAAAAAHSAGGRGGPAHFLHIPQGTVFRRHLAGLTPYTNEICALLVTGCDLRQWLEHAAGVFTRLAPDRPDQPLCQSHRPAFDFDTIYGLDYTIDPTRPVGERLTTLRHGGKAVAPDQKFVLATNQFRAAGGGGGARFDASRILFRDGVSLPGELARVLSRTERPLECRHEPWRFDCAQPVRALIRTTPAALPYLDEIDHLSPEYTGTDDMGFAQIRLQL